MSSNSLDHKLQVDDNDSEFDDFVLEASLKNILEEDSLQWIFVGGKGGVGKTTTSCSLSVMMAQKRSKVLIISTDPAHNLSDAFGQQFGSNPIQVHGINNLFAMEIDPKIDFGKVAGNLVGTRDDEKSSQSIIDLESKQTMSFLSELSSSIPGIDEAMSFAELIKQVKKQDYDCIIFDTAPTGHTLRLLSFPTTLEKAISKIDELKNKFGGILSNFGGLLNAGGAGGAGVNYESMSQRLTEMKTSITQIKNQFENSELTTFVCVCIPEFLSLYETERLAQKLAKFGIDTHNIVINQVLIPEKGSNCKRCYARVKMQEKYIEQFHDLYPDFHIVKIPLMSQEVRHIQKLKKFANLLLNPFEELGEEEREKVINIEGDL